MKQQSKTGAYGTLEDQCAQIARIVRNGRALHTTLSRIIEDTRSAQKQAQIRHENALLAKELVLSVAEKTQLNIGRHISDLVELALSSVFEDPYLFGIDFVQRRGQTEADIWLSRNGEDKIHPLEASGGGVADVVAFGLRLALWTLAKTENTFVLDEPFKFLSADKQENVGLMLKTLADKLNIQFIIVSHQEGVNKGADRIFVVKDGFLSVAR